MNVNCEPARPVAKQGNVFGEKVDHDFDEHASGAGALLGNALVDIHDLREACDDVFGVLSVLEDDLSTGEALLGEARLAHDDGKFSDEELLRRVVGGGSVFHEPLEHSVAVVRACPSGRVRRAADEARQQSMFFPLDVADDLGGKGVVVRRVETEVFDVEVVEELDLGHAVHAAPRSLRRRG